MARRSWLDAQTQTPLIDDYAQQLTGYVTAMADGRVDDQELAAQERRVVELLKQIEPQVDDALHEKLTQLLCEMSAYSMMQVLHAMFEARPKTVFRG